MKKAFILVCVLILMASLTVGVSANLRVGDEIGDVRNTDIRTYVNGYRIPSFNINNRSVVMLRDLVHYGFDTTFNEATRTATLIRNYDKPFNPIRDFEATMGPPGSLAFRHLHTDIVAVINGVTVQSFNVRGYTAILFADLRDAGNFGTMRWNETTRRSTIELFSNPVRAVSIDRSNASVRAGDTFQLGAVITPANAHNRAVTWSSSNTNIATVNNNGVVTGVSVGTATITVNAANGHSATSTITVTPRVVNVNTVTLHAASATFRTGEQFTFNATIAPADATESALTWTSSQPAVATVDSQGRVTGIAGGTTVITATAPNGRTASATVTVTYARPVTSITLDRNAVTVNVGNTTDMIATVSPSNANNRTVTWTTSNENVATVNTNGRITGVSQGTATITATASSGLTANVTVTVGGPAAFALNREYGPFTLRAPQIFDTHILNISSFVFTNRWDDFTFTGTQRLAMRIIGTSSHDLGGHFYIRFMDANNNLLDVRTIMPPATTPGNRNFDFTVEHTIMRTTLDSTARIEFRSASGQLAEPGLGQQTTGYRSVGESYTRFPLVPSFGRVAERTLTTLVHSTRHVASTTSETYTYTFTGIAANTITHIWNAYALELWSVRSFIGSHNETFGHFTRDNITVQMWRAGNTITITVTQTSTQ